MADKSNSLVSLQFIFTQDHIQNLDRDQNTENPTFPMPVPGTSLTVSMAMGHHCLSRVPSTACTAHRRAR